jgi:hypothetical protein
MTSSKTPEIGLGSYQTASIARLRSKTPALHSSPHSLQDTRVLDLTIAVADGFSPPPPVDALDGPDYWKYEGKTLSELREEKATAQD